MCARGWLCGRRCAPCTIALLAFSLGLGHWLAPVCVAIALFALPRSGRLLQRAEPAGWLAGAGWGGGRGGGRQGGGGEAIGCRCALSLWTLLGRVARASSSGDRRQLPDRDARARAPPPGTAPAQTRASSGARTRRTRTRAGPTTARTPATPRAKPTRCDTGAAGRGPAGGRLLCQTRRGRPRGISAPQGPSHGPRFKYPSVARRQLPGQGR
jgi:hypothetical protein